MRTILVLLFMSVHTVSVNAFDDDNVMVREVSLSVDGKPLSECLKQICSRSKVDFEIEYAALLETDLQLDEPKTISFKNIRLYKAIDRLVQFPDHLGVMLELRGRRIVLTTNTASEKRFLAIIPDWLKNHVSKIDEYDQITSVDVHDEDDDDFIRRLVQQLPGLQEIHLGNAKGLTLAGLNALSHCPSLRKIEMYSAGRPANPQAQWTSDEALLMFSKIKSLQKISANDCGISDAGMKHLAKMKQLKSLSLRHNQITDEGLKSLSGLAKLTHLNLEYQVRHVTHGKNKITDAGIKHISGLQNLEFLGIRGLDVKAQTLDFPMLRSLTLGSVINQQVVDDRALNNLQRHKHLRQLTITSDAVTDDGVALLSNLKTLRSIRLYCSSVTDEGLAALNQLPLTSLSLRGVQLTDEGLKHISKFTKLTYLTIYGGMSITTVEGFQQLKSLPSLESLWLYNYNGLGRYRSFGELTQLKSLMFHMADMGGQSQAELYRLAELLPNTNVSFDTGGVGLHFPKK